MYAIGEKSSNSVAKLSDELDLAYKMVGDVTKPSKILGATWLANEVARKT